MLCVEVWGNSLPAKASPRPREQGAVISVTKAARPKFYSLCWLYGIRYMSIFSISVLGRRGIQFTAAATTGCRRDIYPNSASRLTNTRVILNHHALKQSVVTAPKRKTLLPASSASPSLISFHRSNSAVIYVTHLLYRFALSVFVIVALHSTRHVVKARSVFNSRRVTRVRMIRSAGDTC